MIVPIHNHSEYSALDGLSTCKEIAQRAADLGCPCCGLTDHGLVTGHLEFSRVMNEFGVKPIFGCELYQGTKVKYEGRERDQYHLVAGALTTEGLRNLWRLVDKSAEYFRYVGRVNWDMLQQFNEGLFLTSACIQGLVPQELIESRYDSLNRYLDIFGDRFFIELHCYPTEEQKAVNQGLVEIARERGIGLVYATDAHFAFPEQYESHDAYLLKKGETIFTPTEDRKMWHPKSLYIQSEEEVRENLSYLDQSAVDEAIANSVLIGEMCSAEIPEAKDHRPVFIPKDSPWLEKDGVSNQIFIELVEQGIIDRYGEDNTEAWERTAFELEILLEADLADYFLMSWDLMQYCKDKNITVGPGRGSSAGCIVAYALGITDVDPLKYGLYFERFYNPGRAGGLPDIDSDFPRDSRKPIIEYLSNRWGNNRVIVIGNVSRMTPKAALDRFWSKFGVTYDEKEAIKEIILQAVPDIEILDYKQIGWSEEVDPGKAQYIMDKAGANIEEYISSLPIQRQEIIDKWLDLVAIICNRVENYGVHASGVVISDVDLADELPKRWNPDKQMFITQFPMVEVEKRKFMKLDILGLRTLDTLETWKNLMKKRHGVDITWSGLEDEEGDLIGVWELLDKGLNKGIFQIDTAYAAQFAKEMKPRSIEDLAIAGSIIRPGPSMFMDTFIKRRNGEEPVEYDDPFLEDILEPTMGIFLYQEQVIEYFRKLGYSLTEGDEIRRILGKKQPVDLMKVKNGEGIWKGRDYHSLADKLMSHQQAEKIWNNLERFAAYSFNKSHAICYSVNGWRTAFAKYIGTPEYVQALIETDEKKKGNYVAEARRMGIQVSPPDICRSEVDTVISDEEILYGLSNVKGVGKGAARLVIEMRERGMDVSSPEAIDAALDILDAEWKEFRDQAARSGSKFTVLSPRTRLKRNQVDVLFYAGAFNNYLDTEFTLQEIQKYEQEYLDIILSDNSQEIFDNNQDLLSECDSYDTLDNMPENYDTVILPGIITHIRETQTRKAPHKKMGIVKIEYEGDELEFVVFPQHWKAYKFLWTERTPGIFILKKTDRGVNFEQGQKLS